MKKGVKYLVFIDDPADVIGYFIDGIYYEPPSEGHAVGYLDSENNFYYGTVSDESAQSYSGRDVGNPGSAKNVRDDSYTSANAASTPAGRLEGEMLVRHVDGTKLRIQPVEIRQA